MKVDLLTEDLLRHTREVVDKHDGNIVHAARELGIARSTLRYRLNRTPPKPPVEYPVHPEDDIPVDRLVDLMTERASKRIAHDDSKRRQVIKINSCDPIVLAFVGDPHVDDDGCDWPQLRVDIDLMRRTGVYAINIGDSTNNWTGRLMRLYAAQETSRKTARKLARWFLLDSGVKWLVWIMGNHDEWESGADILKLMNAQKIVMDDWSARFTLAFPGDVEVPVWCAHDFPGSSQWNRMHGLMKAAVMKGGAGIYAAGHRHTPGLHWEPLEDKDASYWALRSKGYKAIDSHATRLGHGVVNEGQTTAVVIDPRADSSERVQGFKSLRAAVAYRDAIA